MLEHRGAVDLSIYKIKNHLQGLAKLVEVHYYMMKYFLKKYIRCILVRMVLLISKLSLFLFAFLFFFHCPHTQTNTNCHSGLLLRASESLQMGTAKCRCQSESVPIEQGRLL